MAKLGSFLRDYLTPLLVLVVGGIVVHDHLVPREPAGPISVVDGKALGRKFAATVPGTFGDAWQTAAATLEGGKSVAEAQAALQAKWQEGRAKAFATQVAPDFTRVLGEGEEPTDPTQRAQVVQLWRDFAAGLKGGR